MSSLLVKSCLISGNLCQHSFLCLFLVTDLSTHSFTEAWMPKNCLQKEHSETWWKSECSAVKTAFWHILNTSEKTLNTIRTWLNFVSVCIRVAFHHTYAWTGCIFILSKMGCNCAHKKSALGTEIKLNEWVTKKWTLYSILTA